MTFREYLEMKKEKTADKKEVVAVKKEGNLIVLTIQQRHPRTGIALPDKVERITMEQLDRELENIHRERENLIARHKEALTGLDKRVLNIETLKKDAGITAG
jgi:predicted SnoaL-like aldol condensation-catalyzing enzyme